MVVAAIYFFFQPYLSIDERVMAAVVTCFFSRPYLSIVERVMAAMTYFFLPEVGILATCSYPFCERMKFACPFLFEAIWRKNHPSMVVVTNTNDALDGQKASGWHFRHPRQTPWKVA